MTDSKLVMTEYKHGILTFLLENNRFLDVNFCAGQSDAKIGDIFVAKVSHIVKNIQAAFITYQKDKTGYLSLKVSGNPVLLNRTYDGRIIEGDELLVQLEKEGIRTKEPVFTTNLSLAGRYSVITSSNLTKNVSSKLTKEQKTILSACIPEKCPYGVVVRTNAARLIKTGQLPEITAEINTLCEKMNRILTQGIHRTCFSKVYEEIPEYIKFIRDENQKEFTSVVTDIEAVYEHVKTYFAEYEPDFLEKLSLYNDTEYSLSKLYSVETKMKELLEKKVWLKSGAYLVIEQTEAMYVIDVNSGKNVSKKKSEEVIYQMNQEAAWEIMRQIRLRNFSGMILIDFINMDNKEQETKLLNELRILAQKDTVKTTVVDMTALGIVEITRKKTKKSLKQQLCIDFLESE